MGQPENPYRPLFERQLARYPETGRTTARQRLAKLRKLKAALLTTYRQEIRDALQTDFGKPQLETDLTEIYQVVAAIRHTEAHLRDWMRASRVPTPLSLLGARSRIYYESKGVCLILAPWNYPLNLTLGPLVSAIAAGNCCILKPSEMTPATSALMERILTGLFEPEEVSVVQGDAEVSTRLLELPFHHIFFTGSPRVGRIVMEAAAKNLSSVTLELGGKSPVYIGASANLRDAARRILWGKGSNAGQICVSPDYALVDRSVKDRFVAEFRAAMEAFYPNGALQSPDYSGIVGERHYGRLKQALKDAVASGADILCGGKSLDETCRMEPTLVAGIPGEAALLQEEIFGPILPLVPVDGAEDALMHIRKHPRPLAFYIFSKKGQEVRRLQQGTRAGSSCINHTLIQYSNQYLPFGGINNSGMGKAHGKAGFLAFSNERPVIRQSGWSITAWIQPPYAGWKQRVADLVLKWF